MSVCRPLTLPVLALGLAPVLGLARVALADGTQVGRAGAGPASSEYGAGQGNPAALARRSGSRVWLGSEAIRDVVKAQGGNDGPVGESLSPAHLAPAGGAVWAGSTWLFGFSAATTQHQQIQLPAPATGELAELDHTFPWRGYGIAGSIKTNDVAVVATRRISDAVAIGAALGVRHVALREQRSEAAGIVTVQGAGWSAPSARVGVLVMPASIPYEFGATLLWHRGLTVDGTAAISEGAQHGAALTLPQSIGAAASVRRVANRWTIELDGAVGAANQAVQFWQVRDDAPLASRWRNGVYADVRVSGDVAVIPGMLWLTAGIGWHHGSTSADAVSPILQDPNCARLALGAVVASDGVSVMFGGMLERAAVRTAAHDGVVLDVTSERTVVGLTVEYEFGGL